MCICFEAGCLRDNENARNKEALTSRNRVVCRLVDEEPFLPHPPQCKEGRNGSSLPMLTLVLTRSDLVSAPNMKLSAQFIKFYCYKMS